MQERAQTSVRPITLHALNKIDIRTVQADSCLNFEQIDTLLISGGGQDGLGGGGVILGRRHKTLTCVSGSVFMPPALSD